MLNIYKLLYTNHYLHISLPLICTLRFLETDTSRSTVVKIALDPSQPSVFYQEAKVFTKLSFLREWSQLLAITTALASTIHHSIFRSEWYRHLVQRLHARAVVRLVPRLVCLDKDTNFQDAYQSSVYEIQSSLLCKFLAVNERAVWQN